MVEQAHVVVVGGGFAGLGCAQELAKHPHHARVTLIDRTTTISSCRCSIK